MRLGFCEWLLLGELPLPLENALPLRSVFVGGPLFTGA
jgi:hypothetical protein